MPRITEYNKNNELLKPKYALKRLTPLSFDTTDSGQELFSSKFHISETLGQSVEWFESQKRLLKSKKILFEDPFFPADENSLLSTMKPAYKIEWKRPRDICSNPAFIADGISRFDVIQGKLGDCWLLAAVSSLSMHVKLFDQIMPGNQDFNENYVGAFMFRLWQFGTWIDVVVDDRLPTYKGRLVFMHSKDLNEFWSALLEKAYAKLFNSYEALKGGSSSEAMVDFTGGITELFYLGNSAPSNLWEIMVTGSSRASLMGCSIDEEPGEIEAKSQSGLIKGHAYSITDVKTVNYRRDSVNLVRIRNPWGQGEWTGPWSDHSQEWKEVSKSERKNLGFSEREDGEFWMTFKDFVTYFNKLEICYLSPESELENRHGVKKTKWEMCVEHGEWQKNVTAGGCRNFIDTFHLNPQFHVTVEGTDEDDDDNSGTIIISLMQMNLRDRKTTGNLMLSNQMPVRNVASLTDPLTIGYAIYQLKDSSSDKSPLGARFFRSNSFYAKSTFINLRDVSGRHKLPVGRYAIIPSTFSPGEEAKFLLRIFSEKICNSEQMDRKTEIMTSDLEKGVTPKMKKEKEERNERLYKAFLNIAGEDVEIDAHELQKVLDVYFKREFKFNGFSIETCRSIVAMMDKDLSGKLGFSEFMILYDDLHLWKSVFKEFDRDKSETLNSYELREALNNMGFKVSNRVFTSICTRYANKHGFIKIDEYILLLVRLTTAFLTYKAKRKTMKEEAIFPREEFIQCALYL